MQKHFSHQKRKSQSGVALVEAVIWLPFLIFLFLGLHDISRACNAYLGMNQVLREVMLTATRIDVLKDKTYTAGYIRENEGDTCNLRFTEDCILKVVTWRAYKLIETEKLPIKKKTIRIKLVYDLETRTVVATVTAKYGSIFEIMSFVNLTATASAFVTQT